MYRTVQMAIAAIFAVLFILSTLSRRFPHVAWLQAFRFNRPALDDATRARMRRRANVYAGAELILLGVALPLGYGALTVMTFSSFNTGATVLVAVSSALCIVFGVAGIWRSGRR